MLNNDPKVRAVIYWLAIAAGGVAVILQAIPTTWAEQAATGAQSLASYLAITAGVTAATNLTNGPDTRLLTPTPEGNNHGSTSSTDD